MMKTRFVLLTLAMLAAAVSGLQAEVRLPAILGDNMVLQQGKEVAVWGDADPGENVTVKFARQTLRTKAGVDGKWAVRLAPMEASKTPREMTVGGKGNKITLENVLVGEVWLASGQSNMEYSMNDHPRYAKPKKGDPDFLKKAFEAADSPIIRVLYVEKNLRQDDLPTDGWHVAEGEALAPVSAAGYFFAKRLTEELDVPVGIISSSWGGTPIESWTSKEAYAASRFAEEVDGNILNGQQVARYYDRMIEPAMPYTLRGFLWYQGETNLMTAEPVLNYTEKQKILVDSWRKSWGDGGMPFYYVQISPYTYSSRRNDPVAHTWEALPYFWEAQTLAQDIPYSGMIVTTDLVDNTRDIHPSYKWIVGERLARVALAKTYGKEVEYSGPVFKSMTVEGDKAIIEFDHAVGLTTDDGKAPNWFQIKGAAGRFVNASAAIDGNRVILSAGAVKEPVDVRFAWDEVAMPNLVNGEGLPACPFRTNGAKWSYK